MLVGTLTPVAGGAADIHPLLYYLSLNYWMAVFGQSAFAVRLWSALLGTLTVGVMILLARDLFDDKTALVAAFTTALAPFHVQYSQETRMYALLALLLLAATWFFVRGSAFLIFRRGDIVRQPSIGWWVGFGALAALAMYTQQLAAFYLAALGLIPLLARRRDWFLRVALGVAIALMLYLPWLVNLPSQLDKVRAYYWLDPPGIGRGLLTLRSFLVVNLDIPAPAGVIGLVGAVILAVFLAVQVVFYLRRRGLKAERRPLLFVLWLAAAPPALMWVISQVQPVYLERALLPSALALYLALAWLFTQGRLPRPIAAILAGLGLLLALVGLVYHYTWATFPNSPFAEAAAAVRAEWAEGDRVIHQNKLTALPMIYYDRELPQRYLRDTPGSGEDTLALPTQQVLGLLADACIEMAARDARRVWWVVFDFAEAQYAAAGRPELRRAQDWLSANFRLEETRLFNDLVVRRYVETNPARATTCDEEGT